MCFYCVWIVFNTRKKYTTRQITRFECSSSEKKMQRRIIEDLWCGRSEFFRILIVTCCLAWKWKITRLVCWVNNISQFVRKQFFTAKKWPDKFMSWMISQKMNIAATDNTHTYSHPLCERGERIVRSCSRIKCMLFEAFSRHQSINGYNFVTLYFAMFAIQAPRSLVSTFHTNNMLIIPDCRAIN